MSKETKTTAHEEITKVLDFLGRTHDRMGDVRYDHLSKILNYLYSKQTEDYDVTVSKLTLLLGISKRLVRENFLDGLEAFKIIIVTYGVHTKIWRWNGVP